MSKTDFAQQLVSYGWKSQFISIVVYPEIIRFVVQHFMFINKGKNQINSHLNRDPNFF